MNQNLAKSLKSDDQICATCAWWDLKFAETSTDEEYPIAPCRVKPPIARKKNKQGFTPAIWPYTSCDDWCQAWDRRAS